MKKSFFTFFCFALPFLCMAQLPRVYEYDDAGNRIVRKTVTLNLAPPAPPDSTETIESQMSLKSLEESYFLETIAQTEIKIYPNPTTEHVTLEIAGWETLQNGNFKLFYLTGQLLQEHPVHSLTTTISLATLPRGAYILKVHINGKTENWKIIKQ